MKANAIQQTIFSIAVATTVLLYLSGITLNQTWQLLILIMLVSVAGLPHGAMDPWIACQKGIWKKPMGLLSFMLIYLALVVMFWLIWSYFHSWGGI